MNINIKNLCKQIKKDSIKKNLIWTVENGMHYVTNRHWAVKYLVLPREVLITLFSAFAKIPQEGHTFQLSPHTSEPLERDTPISIEPIFKRCDTHQPSDCTKIITQFDQFSYRIIKQGENLIKVSQDYMQMVDLDGGQPKCGGMVDPISFCDNQLIILPARYDDAAENKMIHELLSAS